MLCRLRTVKDAIFTSFDMTVVAVRVHDFASIYMVVILSGERSCIPILHGFHLGYLSSGHDLSYLRTQGRDRRRGFGPERVFCVSALAGSHAFC